MEVYFSLVIVLLSTILLNELFRRFNLPVVVSQILCGLLLGIPQIKSIAFQGASLDTINFLAEIGIIFLLLLVGLEVDVENIKSSSMDAALIALFSFLVPFIFGFIFLRFLGYDYIASIIFGGALSVTAEGTTVKILMDAGVVNTKIGALIVSAGTIDDIFEVLLLSFATIVGGSKGLSQLIYVPVEIVVFVMVSYLGYVIVRWVIKIIDRHGEAELFSVTVLFVLSLAAFSNYLNIGAIIGAIVAGFILQLAFRNLESDKEVILDQVKIITNGFLIPFFFVNIGLNFNYSYINGNWGLIIMTTILAMSGKILGTLASGFFGNIGWRKLYIVGWGMNSRGAVELVVALIAMQNGIISESIYASLVVMAMITTLIFPFILQRELRRNSSIIT